MKTALVLASNSPRRRQLLQEAGLVFTIRPSTIEEHMDQTLPPSQVVTDLAAQKAESVPKNDEEVVLGADTIVTIDGKILGKPSNEEEAFKTLRFLSGRTHEVFTGVALVKGKETSTFYSRTEVTFYELTDEEIMRYIGTGEPMDKAGAYGIQGKGALFVKEISGDYYAVVGLPLSKTVRELKKLGVSLPQ